MTQPAFDTLSIARRLEQEYGFEIRQAEGVAEVVYRNLIGNVATKEDITTVQEDIATIKTDLAAVKEDIVTIKMELATVKEDIITIRTELAAVKTDIARLEQSTKEEMLRMDSRFMAVFATKAELYKLIGAQTTLIVGLMLALKFIS